MLQKQFALRSCFVYFWSQMYALMLFFTAPCEQGQAAVVIFKLRVAPSIMKYLLPDMSSSRLDFRLIHEKDFDALLPFFRNKHVIQIMDFDTNATAEELCKIWMDKIFYRYENDLGGLNALVLKESGKLAGMCGLLVQGIDEADELEIGYSLLPEFWNRGLATEAAIFCKEQAFDRNFSDSLISIVRPENKSSARVAEKNGMRIEKQSVFHNLKVNIFRIEKPAKGIEQQDA